MEHDVWRQTKNPTTQYILAPGICCTMLPRPLQKVKPRVSINRTSKQTVIWDEHVSSYGLWGDGVNHDGNAKHVGICPYTAIALRNKPDGFHHCRERCPTGSANQCKSKRSSWRWQWSRLRQNTISRARASRKKQRWDIGQQHPIELEATRGSPCLEAHVRLAKLWNPSIYLYLACRNPQALVAQK